MDPELTIAGAGPAGLAAAITIARAGGRVRVFERRARVGARFHDDFQGIENWTVADDALAELARCGIASTFEHTAVRECVLFDARGRGHECRSPDPFFYLVRRGPDPGTLDHALLAQARAAGVAIEFGHPVDQLPAGGIVAHGPRGVDVIAVGYVGETDARDGAFGVISDELAPGGYAYLLIHQGRATLASCMFHDLSNERAYLERTVAFFRGRLGLTLRHARRFGGFGAAAAPVRFREGAVLYAGEAAGLQDALFGFGMRFALVSGHLAGRALAAGDPAEYERACAARLAGAWRTSVVNRFLFERFQGLAARHLVRGVSLARDPRGWLRRYYASRWVTPLLFPLARRRGRLGRAPAQAGV